MHVSGYLKRTTDPKTRASDYQDLVKQYYESVTRFYQHGWSDCFHFAPFSSDETLDQALTAQDAFLVQQASIARGMKVLDVGCGIGGPARRIAQMSGAHITGITISPAQVEVATNLTRKQGLEGRCEFLLGDAMHMQFEDASFDRVYMIESACHMPDKGAFYRECARVLRPGGTLGGWDWVRIGHPDGQDLQNLIEPICVYFALPSLSTLEEIRTHLEGASLEVRMIEDMSERGSVSRRWWQPLERQLGSPLAKITSRFSSTLGMMKKSGDLLVTAGKANVFSPLGFFVASKPAGV